MKFERGENPKHIMKVGLASKVDLEVKGIEVIALVRVYERQAPYYSIAELALGDRYKQVGEARIRYLLESNEVHHIFKTIQNGEGESPTFVTSIFDEWTYLNFRREQALGKYTSQKVFREDMKISYYPDEKSRHTDIGVYINIEEIDGEHGMWGRLNHLAYTYIMFENRIYKIGEIVL